MSGTGDNSIVADDLRGFVERIERLAEERTGINNDIRDVVAEAKACGYDAKIVREVVKLRAMEKHALEEKRALIDAYLSALGVL